MHTTISADNNGHGILVLDSGYYYCYCYDDPCPGGCGVGGGGDSLPCHRNDLSMHWNYLQVPHLEKIYNQLIVLEYRGIDQSFISPDGFGNEGGGYSGNGSPS